MFSVEASPYRPSKKERFIDFVTQVRDRIQGAFDGVTDKFLAKKTEKSRQEQELQTEVFSRAVERAKNWHQLFQVLDMIGKIPTSAQSVPLSSSEIKKSISVAYHSQDPQANAIYVPTAYGLRRKYEQLASLPRENSNSTDPSKATTVQLPALREFIRHYNNFNIRDPDSYDSHTATVAVQEITLRFHSLPEKKQTMQSLILLAANVVNEILPYDTKGRGESADRYNQMTQVVEKVGMGVCRQQAPLLNAVLKRLGFDAHQVWHDWRNSVEGHTLVYVADSRIQAFVNPGSSYNKLTYIPEKKYSTEAYNWRIRDQDGRWRGAPQFEQSINAENQKNVAQEEQYTRPTKRIIQKLRALFTGKK